MGAFEIMQKYYQNRDLAAKEWKKGGGRVVGYFCNHVPEEMILAAGLFPIRISGNPLSGTEASDKYTETYYEANVRSMLNMILTEQYAYVDYIIIPHSRDAILSLYSYLQRIKQIDQNIKLPEIYLFDMLHTTYWSTGIYDRDRVNDLKKKLEEWSGKEISDASLSQAITTLNENKILLKKVANLRVAEPPRISGVDALQIIGSSMFMLKKEHNKLIRQYLDAGEQLPARKGIRVFIEGSPLDNLQFYSLVESCNAIIVGEDNCWGNRYSDCPVDPSLDPLDAITERYHLNTPCSRTHSMDFGVKYCLSSAMAAKAQGVIFYFLEFDNAPCWDYPDQRNALEAKGIPTMQFDKQQYFLSEMEHDKLRTKIRKFIRDISQNIEIARLN